MPSNASAPSTIHLELVEGVASTLPDGTTVNVKDVGYAHLADSQNLSNATLVVSRDGQTVEVGLANAHGGSINKAMTKEALGWEFALEIASPYQQPSRAVVEARKR
jgi:hypothetical protein